MLLEITTTTDHRFIGQAINSEDRPIQLDADVSFIPDRIWQIGEGLWRLANTSYVVDAKEQ